MQLFLTKSKGIQENRFVEKRDGSVKLTVEKMPMVRSGRGVQADCKEQKKKTPGKKEHEACED